MSGGAIHLIPDGDHFEAHMGLERAAAIVDLIANASECADRSPSLAAFAAGDILFDAMKRLHMFEDKPNSHVAPVLELVNAVMAACDDAAQAHKWAVDAICALPARGGKRKLAEVTDLLRAAEEANQRAYMAAVRLGACLP